jgi:hypothetical protein
VDTSNWINLGILVMTGLVGLLSWLGSRNAAKEAREDQKVANAAADRSASAAEDANKIQARMIEIEDQRHQKAVTEAKKAVLVARLDRTSKPDGRPVNHWDLVVSNHGAATARNLEVEIAGKPFGIPESASSCSSMREILIDRGGEVKWPLPGDREFRPPFECKLEWDDDSGVRGNWRSMLT